MDRWRTVLALVGLGCVVLAGVQLADPFRPPPEAPAVEPADPPHRVATDALRQTEARDYTLSIERRDPESGERGDARVLVENSEREVLVRGTGFTETPGTYRRYVNEHVGWRGKAGSLERWPVTWSEFAWAYADLDAIRPGSVEVVRQNETELVLLIADTDLAFRLLGGRENVTDSRWAREDRLRANVTLYVDTEAGVPTRVVYAESRLDDDAPAGERDRFVEVHEYSNWGATEVERPPGAGYTLAEFLFDVADYRGS